MLVEHGFTRATLADGTEYTFTPSLGRVAALGHPREIVELFGRLHGPGAAAAAREVLSVFCDHGDLAPLIGEPEPEPPAFGFRLDKPPRWKPGAITERAQVILARHLMQHAVSGKARPGTNTDGEGEYATEFHVSEHIAAARVHLGLSAEDAAACSMSELQQLISAKFPSEEERKRRNAPSLAELEATERDVAAADARRKELIGG